MGVSGRNRRLRDSLPRYLELRPNGVYGLRFDVPQRLRSLLGRRKFVESHRTHDLATALIRHKAAVARLLALVDSAAAALARTPERLTPVELSATVRSMAESLLAQYQAPPIVTPGWRPPADHPLQDLFIPVPDQDSYSEQALAVAQDYAVAVKTSTAALQAWRTKQLHAAQALLGRVWHPDDTDNIGAGYIRAKLVALGTAAGRHLDWDRYLSGREAIEAMPDPELVLGDSDDKLEIVGLVEQWITARQPATKTGVAVRAIATKLAALADGMAAHQIDIKTARIYRDQRLGDVASGTVAKELALLRAVWGWAAGEDLLPVNPWDSARVTRSDTGVEPRLPFTTEQTALILARSAGLADPAQRWSWPLGLMLGVRIEEICCIRRQDLQMRDNLLCLVIDPEAQLSGQLKTRSSERVIPLPAALLDLDFFEWAQRQRAGYLFGAPSIPAADPRRSHSLSIRNGKALRAWGITSKRLVFHSCRHTFSKLAVEAGLPDRLIQTLMGHSTGKSMTARYSGGYSIAQLKTAIDSLEWPTPAAAVSMEQQIEIDANADLATRPPQCATATRRRTTARRT